MEDNYVRLEFWQLGLAASLILVNALISLALRLGLAKQLLVAALRTVVQLMLVGLVLGATKRRDEKGSEVVFGRPYGWTFFRGRP